MRRVRKGQGGTEGAWGNGRVREVQRGEFREGKHQRPGQQERGAAAVRRRFRVAGAHVHRPPGGLLGLGNPGRVAQSPAGTALCTTLGFGRPLAGPPPVSANPRCLDKWSGVERNKGRFEMMETEW